MTSIFQLEKDAILFLGLMAGAYRRFDQQFIHADKELTHHHGLNIFAVIIDNTDGEVLAFRQNSIHGFNNPLLHAEQLCLHAAIDVINRKRPRNQSITSVENYYRNKLFNDPASTDPIKSGCSIYTTLEPCPFCTSALLVTRMKRIMFIIPDAVYGNSYDHLKSAYYAKYDMHYGQFSLEDGPAGSLITNAVRKYTEFLAAVRQLKIEQPKLYDTLLLDFMQPFLARCYADFAALQESSIITTGKEKEMNSNTLYSMQKQIDKIL